MHEFVAIVVTVVLEAVGIRWEFVKSPEWDGRRQDVLVCVGPDTVPAKHTEYRRFAEAAYVPPHSDELLNDLYLY